MLRKRLNRRGGINRLTALLLALIAVMLVVIAVPRWQVFRYRSEKTACEQAMKSARDGLIIEYLGRWDAGTVQQAMVTLDEVMPARPDICPSGGTVYLVRGENDIFEPICGLHDDDTALRARLNASRALELLEDGLRQRRREVDEEPESVDIRLNGSTLTCVRVDGEQPLYRGTRTTKGYEGVVAFYGLAGEGDFADVSLDDADEPDADTETETADAPAGDADAETADEPDAEADDAPAPAICYFLYADENHCAVWRANDGWTGEAYELR